MILRLTRKSDGKEISVNTELIKIWEPADDGSTFVVFSEGLVRNVNETIREIDSAMGSTAPAAVIPEA